MANVWSNDVTRSSNRNLLFGSSGYCSLYFSVKNSLGAVANFDASPVFELWDVDSDAKVAPLVHNITNTKVGCYTVNFSTSGLVSTTYKVLLTGNISAVEQQIVGSITIATPSPLLWFMVMLRRRLYDFDPTLYQIDDARKLLESQLSDSLLMTLNDINFTGPALTRFTIENIPCWALLLDGAYARAIDTFLKLEIANTYTEPEEPTVGINRAPLYQVERDIWMNYYKEAKLSFKKAWKPYAVGLRGSRFPFMITQIMSLTPGFESIFG